MKYLAEMNGKKVILDGDTPPRILAAFAKSGFSLTKVEGEAEEEAVEETKEIRKKEREA